MAQLNHHLPPRTLPPWDPDAPALVEEAEALGMAVRFNWAARRAHEPWIELYAKDARDKLLGSFVCSAQAIKWIKKGRPQPQEQEQQHG